jgi:hypothetical protein
LKVLYITFKLGYIEFYKNVSTIVNIVENFMETDKPFMDEELEQDDSQLHLRKFFADKGNSVSIKTSSNDTSDKTIMPRKEKINQNVFVNILVRNPRLVYNSLLAAREYGIL